MNTTTINIILLLLSPFLAILANGVFRKLYARFQNRKGPPIVQTFYDLIKLWEKKGTSSDESKNAVFYSGLFTALLFLIAAYLIFFGAISFENDFIVFIYLLLSVEVAIISSALSSKNALGYVASMRELVLMLGYELAIAFSIINISSISGITVVSSIQSSVLAAPISIIILIISGFAVLRVTPYDTVNAHSEISSGMTTEYSGKTLMLYLFIEKLKDFMFYLLLSRLIIGWNIYTAFVILSLVFFYSLYNASSARYSFLNSAKKLFILALFTLINVLVIHL